MGGRGGEERKAEGAQTGFVVCGVCGK